MRAGTQRRLIGLAVVLWCGCTERVLQNDTEAQSSATGSGSTTETSAHDSSDPPQSSSSGAAERDIGAQPPTECDCVLELASQRSGSLDVVAADPLAVATLGEHIVFALGTHGAGRYVVTADSSIILPESEDCQLLPWLAGTSEPRILVFGNGDDREIQGAAYPSRIRMPSEYVGHPERLLEDFDVVVYFEDSAFRYPEEPETLELETLAHYLGAGGGVIASSEYAGSSGYLARSDINSINRLLEPIGFRANVVSLPWGNTTTQVALPCDAAGG